MWKPRVIAAFATFALLGSEPAYTDSKYVRCLTEALQNELARNLKEKPELHTYPANRYTYPRDITDRQKFEEQGFFGVRKVEDVANWLARDAKSTEGFVEKILKEHGWTEDKARILSGFTVGGHYYRNGITDRLYRGYGSSNIELDAPFLEQQIERSFQTGGLLHDAPPMDRRYFLRAWNMNADSSAIDRLRALAETYRNEHKDFWELGKDIHSRPNLEVLSRLEKYISEHPIPNNPEHPLREMEHGIKLLLNLPEDSAGTHKPWTQLARELEELRGARQSAGEHTSPASAQDLVAYYRSDFKNSEHALSTEMNLIHALEGTPFSKDWITSAHLILDQTALDDLLPENQVRFYKGQADRIELDPALKDIDKIRTLKLLLDNALTQINERLWRAYGHADGIYYAKAVNQLNLRPASQIDTIQKTTSALALGNLVDLLSKESYRLSGIVHRIGASAESFPGEVLVPGKATGVLRILRDGDPPPRAGEIAVGERLPDEVGQAAGLISFSSANRLDHPTLLARSLGIPTASLDPKAAGVLEKLNGTPVELSAAPEGALTLLPSTQAVDSVRHALVPLPPVDLTETHPLLISRSAAAIGKNFAGNKSMHYLKLYHTKGLQGHVLDGVILPYGFFRNYLKTSGLTEKLAELEKTPLDQSAKITQLTGEIRKTIATTRIPQHDLEDLGQAMRQLHPAAGETEPTFFFRSASSLEDLDLHNGAGVGLTLGHVRVFGTNRSPNLRKIDQTLRVILAAEFDPSVVALRGRTFTGKTALSGNLSMLVLPTLDTESSGVAIVGSPALTPGRSVISANWGAASVVSATKPVEEATWTGSQYLTTGLTVYPGSPGRANPQILDPARIQASMKLFELGAQSLGPKPNGWDTEWARSKRGTTYIFQMRAAPRN